ncbi:MAG: DUF5700 domain-containing putative Zn-dependent protease, partial [Bacteroidota bacterium]
MKNILTAGLLLCLWLCHAQQTVAQESAKLDLEIIDLSQKQIELMNTHKDATPKKRDKALVNGIYKPYSNLWKGYLGNPKDFKQWLNEVAYQELETYNEKSEKIDLLEMNRYFDKTVSAMEAFTGHRAVGKWYVFFGPKWTNLGGFEDGTMLIDLAHNRNNSMEAITTVFPHELNHQIYSNTMRQDSKEVLHRIVNEGFACYVSYLFHKGERTVAEELFYSEAQYQFCLKNEEEILQLLAANHQSDDAQKARNFASRGYRFKEGYPGAIGY